MRLSLATRIFLGYAVVLATFGAVSLFSVRELHQNQQEIRLVSQGYLVLLQETATIETFHRNQERDTERLLEEKNVDTRRALIRLARLYFPPLMAQRIQDARTRAKETARFAPESEVTFLGEVEGTFADLQRRYAEYEKHADAAFRVLEQPDPVPEKAGAVMAVLKQEEGTLGREVRVLHESLKKRLAARVEEAERRERRTGMAIIGLSVLAIAVGVLATWIAARTLRPVRSLIEGVSRFGQGDYPRKLGLTGDDEISTLARAFDGLGSRLKERDRELREKQEALLRAEQLAAVGRISAQVAHEVRNPLSSIGLNVEMLDDAFSRAKFEDASDGKEVKELLGAVTKEVDRLTEVTEQYLRMARVPRPQLGKEDLNEVVSSVLAFQREELQRAKVEVEERLDPSAPKALADEGQLRQVFLNLLRNSREAMPSGGKLTVESRAENGKVEVTFRDTGTGMSKEIQDHIFEPFFSTKEKGTGLGLAVSRQILAAHGGDIACESAPGKGTTFRITLPRA